MYFLSPSALDLDVLCLSLTGCEILGSLPAAWAYPGDLQTPSRKVLLQLEYNSQPPLCSWSRQPVTYIRRRNVRRNFVMRTKAVKQRIVSMSEKVFVLATDVVFTLKLRRMKISKAESGG
jgi:hypothetical protein